MTTCTRCGQPPEAHPPQPAISDVTTAQLERADRVRKARHDSTCHTCRNPIRTGQPIARVAGKWRHLTCLPAIAALARETITRE